MRALAHLNKYLWHYKWQIIWGTVFIVASNLFAIYAPRMIREAFDLITESLDTYQTGNVSDYALKLPYSVSFLFDLFNISTERFTDINSIAGLTKAITSLSVLLAILYLARSEEHTSELQSRENLVCRLLLEKKKKRKKQH